MVGARVVSVLLLEGVYGCLVGQMAQWRCEMESVCVGGRGEGGGGELVSIQSLLLPLSCVVVFAVESLPHPSLFRLPRSVSLTGISFYLTMCNTVMNALVLNTSEETSDL